MANSRYTAQEMREMADAIINECEDEEAGLVYESPALAGHIFYPDEASAMLRQAAEMREMCEVLLEDIVKCKSHHTGICPAHTGEIISYWNCPKDKPCAKAVIIKELRALLRGNARKEEK